MATTKTKSAYQKALEKKKTGKSSTTSTKVKNINGAAANDGKSPYKQAYAKARSLRQLNGAKHVDFQGNAKQAVTDYTKSQAEKQQKQYQQQVNNAATKTANQVATTYGTGIANTQGFKNYMQQLSKAQENATGTAAKVPSISSVDAFRTSPKQDNYTSLYTKLGMNQPTKTTSTTNNTTSTGATDYKKNTAQNAQTLQSGRKTGRYDNENNLGTSYEEGMSDAFINNRIKKTQKEINDLQTTGDYADHTRQQEYQNAQQTKKQLEQRLAEVRRDAQNGSNPEKRKQEVADLQAQIENENAIIQRYEQQYGTKSGAQIGQEAMTQKNAAGLNNIQAGTAYMGNGFNAYMQQLNALNGKGTAGTGSTTATNQYGLQNTQQTTTPFMKSLGEVMGQTIKTPIKNEGAERYSLSREQYDNAVETKEKAEKTLEDVEGRLQDAIDTGNTAMAEQLQQQKNAIQAQIENENTIIERTKENATAELTLADKQTTLQNYQEVQNNRGKVQSFEDEARNAADFDTLSDGSDATQPTGHQDYYTIQYQLVNLGSDYEPYGRDQDITDTMKQAGVDLMTEDEKAVYNYFYNSGDKTKADAYLTALSPTLRARRTEAQNAESYNYSYEHPVLGTLESAATNVVNGAIFTPFQWMGAAMGSNDTNTVFYDYLNRTNHLRSGAGEKIADEVGNVMGEQAGDVAQWLYNTGNSAIDSFVSAAIGSVMMGAPIMGSAAMTAAQKVGTQAISLGLMSSQAASQTLKEKLDSGMDSGKAILYSAVYGGIESLTEIYSLEALMGDPTKFGLYLLKNFAAEGSEEIAGDFLRPAVDWVIARATDDKTELEQTYEGYLKQGMTAKEATMHTLGDWGVDTILDGLAGGISGVGSSVVYGGVGKLQEIGQASSLGGEIISNDTTSNIISVAETLDQNGKAYKLAQEMQEGKKKQNAYNVGKLLQLTMEETGGAAGVLQEQFAEDIAKRLQEKGETENVEEVAAAAATLMSTGTVTAEQAAVLSESKYGMEVLNEASQDMSTEAVQRRQENWKNRQAQQRIREAVQTRETNNTNNQNNNEDNHQNNQDETSGTEEHTEEQQGTRTEEEEQKAEEAETKARETLTEAQAADTAGEAVKVQEITSTTKTGTATVKVAKDNTVTEMKLQDVSFDNERQATAYRMAAQMETPTKGQAFLQMLKTTTMPLDTARAAFNVIYDAGLRGTTLESSGITEEYRQMIGAEAALNAYEAGAQAQAKQNARMDFAEDVVQELRDTVAALPETVSEDYVGVVYKATSKSTLSQAMAAQIVLIDQVAKRYGMQVEITDQAGSGAMKGKMNGRYVQGTNRIQIGLDSDQGLLTRTLAHEMTHFIKEWNADGYTELAAFISAKLQESDGYSLQERIEEKQEQYKQIGQELTEEAALEEIVADSMFKVFENEKYLADLYEQHETLAEKIKSKLKNFAQELKNAAKRLKNAEAQAMAQQEAEHLDELVEKFNQAATVAYTYSYLARDAAKEAKAQETKEGTEEGKLSLKDQNKYDYSKTFAEQVEDFTAGKIPQDDTLLLGRTPAIFQEIGLGDLPMTMDQTHLKKALNGIDAGHTFSKEEIKQLPGKIAEPLLVIESKTRSEDSVVAFVDMQTNGGNVITPIRIETKGMQNGQRIDANHVVSFYGKENAAALLKHAVAEEEAGRIGVYYVDMEKGPIVLKRAGLQLPGRLNNSGLTHTITDEKSPVKSKGTKKQTETQQFKRWFANSKAVDEYGEPLALYHQTTEEKAELNPEEEELEELGAVVPKGIVLRATETTEDAQSMYATIREPLEFENLKEAEEYFKKRVPGYADALKQNTETAGKLLRQWYDERICDGLHLKDSGTWVAFYAEQVKSTTDNVGTFDGNNRNARFSLKEDGTLASLQDVDAINMTMRQEIEDNKEFRDMLRQLNRVARTCGEITAAQQKDVRRIAAKLIKQWNVDAMTQKTLAANLTTAFNAMANAKTTAETEIAMEAMADIAQDLIEQSGHYDTSAAEQYGAKSLLEDFKHGKVALSEQDWKEATYRYGSARAFRKAYAGIWNPPGQKVKNSKGWASCDDVLHNAIDIPASEGGVGFRVEGDEVGTPFDQVEAFLKAVEPKWVNMEEQSLKEYGEFDAGTVATEMATKIYEEYLNMKQYTTAEEQNAETIKQQNKQIEELKKQMEKNREELKKTKRKLQDSVMENIDNKYKQMERREKEEKKAARREIIRQSNRIANKLAAPKNGSFVPWTMRGAVEKLLQMVDFTNIENGKTSTTVLEEKVIREAMEAYMELGEVKEDEQDEALKRTKDFFNADLKEDFNQLLMQGVGKQLGDLSIEDLNHLKNIMSGYAAAIINADKLFMGEKAASLTDTGDNFIFEMNTRKPHKKQGGLAQALDRSLGSGLLKPYTVFYKLKGTEMEAVWKNLRNAEGKHIRNVQSAAGFLENTLEEFHHQETINMDSKQQRKNGFTLELESGESIKLTREEMLTITAVYKREKMVGTQHLLKGGITLRDADKGTKMDAYHLTMVDLQKMEEALTEEEKNYRDKMVGYLSNECSEWGNEVTREMYGVEKFTEKYYIPFQVDSNVLANDPAQAQDQRLKVGSFTKALKNKASNTIQIVPFTELWCSHVEKMSDYNAFVLPIENMTRLMNYKTAEGGTVKVAMNKGYGKETTQYIMSFLKNLNGNTRTSDADRWYKQLSGKAKGAAVTFNMSVAFQQAGAGVRAASVINPKYIAKGMVTGLNVNKSYAELEKYAPIAVLKGWGYFDTQQARGLYDRARSDWKGKLSEIAGAGAEFGDKLNWAQMWEAVKAEQEDMLKGEKEETILKAAGERFQDVIDQTQVVDSVFQRARWAYEPSHIKDAFLNFMSEPITQYNMLYRAIYDIQEAKNNPDVITKEGETQEQLKARGIRKAYMGLVRTIVALATSGALTAALKTIWTAMRDRDDDKKEETEDGKTRIVGRRTYWDKYSDAYWGNFLDSWEGMVPIFSTMLEPIMNALSGESTYSSTSNELGTQAVDYLAKFISQMQKYISGKSDDMGSALYYLCTAVSYGTGVGFNALFRDVNSVFQTALGAANSEFVFMKDGTFLGVREMANTAWDSSKDFGLRLQTAQDYYVYNKGNVTNRGGDVDNRTQSSDVYVTLGVYAYYNYGLDSDEFKQAAQAAIDQGATSDGFATSVKNRIKQTEPAVTEAAQALVDGDMELYRQKISEIMATGIGSKPAEQMVKAIYNGMIDQPEEDPGNGGGVVGKLKENVDKGSDTAAGELVSDNLTDSMTNLDAATFSQAVEDMKTVGYTEAQIKTKITTGLKKRYRQACWDGDTETATTIGKMITGAGVGLTNEDLYNWANDTSELYTAVEDNDTKKATKIFKYLINNAKDKTATRKNLDTQLKKKYKAAEGEAKTNMKALLLKLGYAESTINGWK